MLHEYGATQAQERRKKIDQQRNSLRGSATILNQLMRKLRIAYIINDKDKHKYITLQLSNKKTPIPNTITII